MVLVYLIAIALAVVIALVLWAQLGMWGSRPAKYADLALDEIAPFIKSWAPWLAERGRIVVTHRNADAEVEIRKFRFATRPDVVHFRVRNADSNKKHFPSIQAAFDEARLQYTMELTARKKAPRAMAVELLAEDLHTPAAARRLVELAFGGIGVSGVGFCVHVDGSMRVQPDVPSVVLVPWSQSYRSGYRVGKGIGSTLRRFLSP